MPTGHKINSEDVKRLHGEGLSDTEIAEKLGCGATAVLIHRRELGLKRHPRMRITGSTKFARMKGPRGPRIIKDIEDDPTVAAEALLYRVWTKLTLAQKVVAVAPFMQASVKGE